MKTTVIVCRSCLKTFEVSRAAKSFWATNGDIGYVCAGCIGKRVHAAVIAADVAKFQAITHAYQTITGLTP